MVYKKQHFILQIQLPPTLELDLPSYFLLKAMWYRMKIKPCPNTLHYMKIFVIHTLFMVFGVLIIIYMLERKT